MHYVPLLMVFFVTSSHLAVMNNYLSPVWCDAAEIALLLLSEWSALFMVESQRYNRTSRSKEVPCGARTRYLAFASLTVCLGKRWTRLRLYRVR